MANSLGIGSWRKWCLLVMILVWLNYYLVGGWPTPLKNMSSSVGMIFPNMGKNVPNHKPVMVIITSSPTVSLISLISLVLNANIATWAPPCTATRWVSNLLCRWARRFSFHLRRDSLWVPAIKVSDDFIGYGTIGRFYTRCNCIHNCSIYLLHPFCGNSCWSRRCF